MYRKRSVELYANQSRFHNFCEHSGVACDWWFGGVLRSPARNLLQIGLSRRIRVSNEYPQPEQ